MNKKMKMAGYVAVAALLAGNSYGAFIQTTGGGGNWTNTTTWIGGSVPDADGADTAVIRNGHVVVVDSAVASSPSQINVGQAGLGTLNINAGGDISSSVNTLVGNNAGGDGTLNINAGNYSANNRLLIGNNGGTGTVNLDGGELYIGNIFTNALTILGSSTLDITDGLLKWNADNVGYRSDNQIGALQGYVGTGDVTFGGTGAYVGANDALIIATNGASYLYAQLNGTSGATEVWSTVIPEPATVGLMSAFGLCAPLYDEVVAL